VNTPRDEALAALRKRLLFLSLKIEAWMTYAEQELVSEIVEIKQELDKLTNESRDKGL
jgi:hypothetical protein